MVDAAHPLRQPGVAWIGAHQIIVEGFVHVAFTMWSAARLGKRVKRPGPTPVERMPESRPDEPTCDCDNALSDRLWRL
jgi:hypothetical protein